MYKNMANTSLKKRYAINLNEANNTDKILILVLCSLAILLSILIGVVIQYKNHELEQLGQRVTLTKFWIPCDDLSLSLDEDAETFDGKTNYFKHFVDADGTNICLFNNLTEIVSKNVERTSRIRFAKGLTFQQNQSCGNPDLEPESGNMTAVLSKLSTWQPEQKDVKQVQQLYWDVASNYSYAGKGVKFNKGRIQVTEGSIYFVYAIITINNTIGYGECGPCMFTVSIYKTNVMYVGNNESRELQERETLCNRNIGISTLYMGSHVYLDKGDIIYVKVSDLSSVILTSSGNALGLFPLS